MLRTMPLSSSRTSRPAGEESKMKRAENFQASLDNKKSNDFFNETIARAKGTLYEVFYRQRSIDRADSNLEQTWVEKAKRDAAKET